jgi:hypothetical protein
MSSSNVFIKWSLVKNIGMELITMDGFVVQTYPTTTLARLTLIILFLEMLKISNLFSNIFLLKRTIEYSRIYYLSKL